jgi:hypothetical protein
MGYDRPEDWRTNIQLRPARESYTQESDVCVGEEFPVNQV